METLPDSDNVFDEYLKAGKWSPRAPRHGPLFDSLLPTSDHLVLLIHSSQLRLHPPHAHIFAAHAAWQKNDQPNLDDLTVFLEEG